MKEHQILFSAPMVRAILDGRKTQTRRIMNPQPTKMGVVMHPGFAIGTASTDEGCVYWKWPCRHGTPGTPLWVRETWAPVLLNPVTADRAWWPGREPWPGIPAGRDRSLIPDGQIPQQKYNRIIYRADGEMPGGFKQQWKPSIFMPRWASRITLEVTGVRVERLGEISEADAKDEGVRPVLPLIDNAHRVDFKALWDKINGKRADWMSNPWVWVVEFRRLESARRAA